MKLLLTIFLACLTLETFSQDTLNLTYDNIAGRYEYSKSENKRLWKENAENGYIIRIANDQQLKYEIKFLSAKTINYKVGVPTGLSSYFGLVDLTSQPTQPGPGPKIKSIERDPVQSDRDRIIVDLRHIKVNKNQGFDALGLYTANLAQSMYLETSAFQEEFGFLDSLGYEYISKSVLAAEYTHLLGSYDLIQPIVEEFDAIYSHLLATDNSISSLLKALRTAASEDQSQIYSSSIDLLKFDYKVSTTKELQDTIKSEVSKLKALNESLEETIQLDLKVDQNIIDALMSINQAQYFIEQELNVGDNMKTVMALDGSKRFAQTGTLRYTRNADATRVKLLVLDRYNSKDTVLSQQLDIPIYKGIDLEFSTGFIYNNLYQRDYYIELDTVSNPSDTLKNIQIQDDIQGDISFAALFHASFRRPWARIGFSGGIGIGLTDGKPRYLLGLHALLFARQSLGFSGGLAWAKVNSLSNTLSDDGKVANNPFSKDLGKVETFETMARGWYAGIVWNFARK